MSCLESQTFISENSTEDPIICIIVCALPSSWLAFANNLNQCTSDTLIFRSSISAWVALQCCATKRNSNQIFSPRFHACPFHTALGPRQCTFCRISLQLRKLLRDISGVNRNCTYVLPRFRPSYSIRAESVLYLSPTKRMRTSSRALQPPLPCPTILTFYPHTNNLTSANAQSRKAIQTCGFAQSD